MEFDFIYIIPPDGVRCPFCAQTIPPDAVVCSFCHRDLSSSELWVQRVQKYHSRHKELLAMAGVVVAIFVGIFVVMNWPDDWLSYYGHKSQVSEPESKLAPPIPIEVAQTPAPITPHPAKEAIAEAARLYPGLRVKDSPMNKEFLSFYEQAKKGDAQSLASPAWPLAIAARAAQSLGIDPVTTSDPVRVSPAPPQLRNGSGHASTFDNPLDRKAY